MAFWVSAISPYIKYMYSYLTASYNANSHQKEKDLSTENITFIFGAVKSHQRPPWNYDNHIIKTIFLQTSFEVLLLIINFIN